MNEVYKYLDITRKIYEKQIAGDITQDTVDGIVNNYDMAMRILCQLIWDRIKLNKYNNCYTRIEFNNNDLANTTIKNEITIELEIEKEYKEIIRRTLNLIVSLFKSVHKFPHLHIDVNSSIFIDGYNATLVMRNIVDNDDIEIENAGFLDGNAVDDKVVMVVTTVETGKSVKDYLESIIEQG